MLKLIRYHLIPPIFISFFTWIVQYLSIIGKGEIFTSELMLSSSAGNHTTWIWSAIVILWAFALLKLSDPVMGPASPSGCPTIYSGSGFSYYCLTMILYVIIDAFCPLSEVLYDNFPELLGTFNLIAFALCIFLLIKGKIKPSQSEDLKPGDPILYEFYRGVELHPYLFGVNVKQLTNCRVGMMGWQLYILAFFTTSLRRFGLNSGFLANFLLQTIYIAKFFWWEVGYFSTLDMMLDRAGYYICWGCLVWVPCLYTYTSYYIVRHQSSMEPAHAVFVFILGVASILLNYRVDYEKETFRAKKPICRLWGRDVTFVEAEYTNGRGDRIKSALLTSGFWGIARHMNYTFELLAAFFWCLAGGLNNFPIAFSYFFFLFVLLVHRTIRDEEKCRGKYGESWTVYCQRVRYRLLPFVW